MTDPRECIFRHRVNLGGKRPLHYGRCGLWTLRSAKAWNHWGKPSGGGVANVVALSAAEFTSVEKGFCTTTTEDWQSGVVLRPGTTGVNPVAEKPGGRRPA